jgi:prepilin-type N-terminal cleavage/methylation domain-containing protein
MTRAAIRRRLRALPADERGFTLIETLIAITIIFGSLVVLAYAATIGFGYEDLARQKQTATGIADQMMEQARGLAWDRIVEGHLTSDISTSGANADPNLVTGCAGDAVGAYRLFSCTPDTARPGAGELIVKQSSTACTTGSPNYPKCVYPLVLHSGTMVQNNITYTWRAYDTNSCPTATSTGCATQTVGGLTTTLTTPYRMTVLVTWTGGKAGPSKFVQVQSLFWSPAGCRSTATHPFAAPCQPFFLGVASVPQGNINIAQGSDPSGAVPVSGTSFVTGDIYTSGVDSTVQSEQLSGAEGSFEQSSVRLDDGTITTSAGDTAAASAADTDPGTASANYASVICPDATYACAGGSVSTGVGNVLTLTAPAGETARSTSTTSAAGTNVCPPPTDTAQADGKPCAGSRIQQGGTLSAVLTLGGTTPALGSATLARILALASNPNKTFVDRVQNGQVPAGFCAPIASSDGCIEATATRRMGTLNVGALPSAITAPAGWSGASAWQGYYFSIVGYQDSIRAVAGTNSTPTAAGANVVAPPAPTAAGTVYCWDGASGYVNVAASSTTAVVCAPLVVTQVLSGKTVVVTMTATTTPRQVTRSPSADAASLTDVTAQVTPPSATIQYTVTVDGVTVVNLAIAVNMSTMEARGSYAVAPASGS